jgi:uncharacterized membrane protein
MTIVKTPRDKRIIFIYALTLAGIIVWLAAIALAPYLRSQGHGLAPFVYACFSPLCHQVPSRSFYIFGFPLAVCARCLGIYLGFFAGTMLYPLRRGFSALRLPKTPAFLAVSFPIVFDTAANILHIWKTPNVLRLATGILWGLILPFYFITGVAEISLHWTRKKH